MKTEPVRIVSLIIGLVLAAIPHLDKFGVPITVQQIDALEVFLPTVLVLIGGEFVRARVSPVAK